MDAQGQLDPKSLVARIIAELQANPDAQRLLLHALLTNEFLGMPARLNRIEKDIAELKADVAELKTDVAQLKTDVAELKTDVAELKTDVAELKVNVADLQVNVANLNANVADLQVNVANLNVNVANLNGSDLENRLHRRIRALVSQALELRRPRIVHSPVQETAVDFADRVEDALDQGRITKGQDARLEATDFIIHAQRRADRAPVWIAVEASNKVHAKDIERARATAEALSTVFETDAVAVVAGYGIDALDAKRADDASVRYLEVSPPGAN